MALWRKHLSRVAFPWTQSAVAVPVARRSFVSDSAFQNDTEIAKTIRQQATRQTTDVSLAMMMEMGSEESGGLIGNAKFLREELPIRLAKRVLDLTNLPYNMSAMPSVQRVLRLYMDSFKVISTLPLPHDWDTEKHFSSTIEQVLTRHREVVTTLAVGIKELKHTSASSTEDIIDNCPFLQDFLDRFYYSRLGIRLLIAHHIALSHPQPGWIGVIEQNCTIAKIIQDAADDAEETCLRTYGVSPSVSIVGKTDLTFSYIPQFMHYVMYELLKNSLRAVVERFGIAHDNLPETEVVIADGEDDVVVKVSDRGGGFPRSTMEKVWRYSYTTAPEPGQVDADKQATIGPLVTAPMAGFGYGLPMSRLHARAFKGDLVLIPMDGYGLDAYLYTPKMSGLNSAVSS